MSIADIRAMRLSHVKPVNLVAVVIGTASAPWKGDATLIELPSGSLPRMMDWRPVVGLWAVFYMIQPDWTVLDAAVDCAAQAGAKLFGFVHQGIAHPLCIFEQPEDQKSAVNLMRAEWETICS